MACVVFARPTPRPLTHIAYVHYRHLCLSTFRLAPSSNSTLANAPPYQPKQSNASNTIYPALSQISRRTAGKKSSPGTKRRSDYNQKARLTTKLAARKVTDELTQKILKKPKWCGAYRGSQYLCLSSSSTKQYQPAAQPIQTKMKCSVEVLTTPTADTPGTSLLLEFPDKRYVIGRIHEGCQRAIVERGRRLVKITDIFLTGKVEWRNTGGLLGLIITAADSKAAAKQAFLEDREAKKRKRIEQMEKDLKEAGQNSKRREKFQILLEAEKTRQAEAVEREMATGVQGMKPSLGIHGGRNILHTVATSRRFIFRRGVPLHVHETMADTSFSAEKPTWSDSNIQVFAMPTTPNGIPDDQRLSSEDSEILHGVVRNMFDSDWQMDALFETKLADVKMPAAIFVRDEETHKIEKWIGPKPGEVPEGDLPDVKVLVRKPWPAALVTGLPQTSPSSVSMSYFIKSHPQRGRFLPEKARALGVEPRNFKILAAGETLDMADGTTVTPEQVLEPTRPGKGFAVIEIPSNEYIKPVLERPEWKCNELMQSMEGIFWILGANVLRSPEFVEFVGKLTGIQHAISAPESSPNYLAMKSASSLQLRLAKVSHRHHPVLEFNDRAEALPDELMHCARTHPGQILEIEPASKWNTSETEPLLNCSEVIQKMSGKVKALAATADREIRSEAVQNQLAAQRFPGANAEIITLGTGSAVPSKYRNVSATLLRVPGYGSYLFDCGENTMGQLARLCTPGELRDILRDLRMIWISHMHADHHLGTTSVIKAWHEAKHGAEMASQTKQVRPDGAKINANPTHYLNRNKLVVASDSKMLEWLWEYAAAESFGLSEVAPLSVGTAGAGNPTSTPLHLFGARVAFSSLNADVSQALKDSTRLVDLQAAPVDHCAGAKAVSITFEDGFKVSYSGDCRPSKRFVEIGKGSTLLIHEATFDDELMGDAVAKKHSTVSEAIKVGVEMGAPYIMLTHFSQRYAKIAGVSNVKRYRVKFQDADGDASDDIPMEHLTGSAADSDGPPFAVQSGQSLTKSESAESLRAQVEGEVDVKVGAAFDFMRVKVKDIAILEKFRAATSLLLDNEASLSTEKDGGDESPRKRKSDEELQKPKKNKGKGRS